MRMLWFEPNINKWLLNLDSIRQYGIMWDIDYKIQNEVICHKRFIVSKIIVSTDSRMLTKLLIEIIGLQSWIQFKFDWFHLSGLSIVSKKDWNWRICHQKPTCESWMKKELVCSWTELSTFYVPWDNLLDIYVE